MKRSAKYLLIFVSLALANCAPKVKFDNLESRSFSSLSEESALRRITPALAVRGVGCMSCHSQVSSNLVTDLGYGGDGNGNDYFFNSPNSWATSFYGDIGASSAPSSGIFTTIDMAAEAKLIVPKANVPSAAVKASGYETLADYIRYRMKHSEFASSAQVEIVEVSQVKIGTSTESRLKEAFEINSGESSKFFKDSNISPALSGLSYDSEKKLFVMDGTVNCDGDLFVDGTLFMNGVVVESIRGCRLYVTGTVFINEGLQSQGYKSISDEHNIQIVSSRAIILGSGKIHKHGQVCETSGWYKDNFRNSDVSSLDYRLERVEEANAVTRNFGSTELKKLIAEESKKLPVTYDASCESVGRGVDLKRVLFNAPWVLSRYNGNVEGSIIAEIALMALGDFQFKFDQVFQTVPVLPLLEESEILAIQ